MAASLTTQIRLGFSQSWRIWTPNEVGFYAKTLAHSYFILMILKSKFIKHHMCIINYTIIIGKSKYFVFIEFLKFGLGSKEERSYWKKILYITLIARHNKFERALGTKKLPYYEKKNQIKMIKTYLISKGKKGYMIQKRFNVHHKRLGKKIINTNFKEFIQKKFKELSKDINFKIKDFEFGKKIIKPKELNKSILFRLTNFPNFYSQVEIFGLYLQKNKKFTNFQNSILKIKKPFIKVSKKKIFKKKTKKKQKKLNMYKRLNKFTKEFGKIIIRSNYNNFLNLIMVKNLKKKKNNFRKNIKQKLNRFGFEIPILYNLKLGNFKKYIIKKKVINSFYLKKFETNSTIFNLSIIKKDFTKIYKNEFQRTTSPSNEMVLLRALKRKKASAYQVNKIIGFGQKVWLRKNYKKMLEYTTLRCGHFDGLLFPEVTLFSFGGGPRKRLSRNLKRAFKSKGIKKLINLIWFWEKIARLLSYIVFKYKDYSLFTKN